MFQDIRTPKRSLRDVLPARVAEPPPRSSRSRETEPEAEETLITLPPEPRRRRGSRVFPLFVVFLVALVIAGGYLASQSLASAKIELTPKELALTLNHERILVPYEVMKVEPISVSKVVKTVAGGTVEKKASGKITIYNEYSSASQALIAATRFQAPNGKIYRISSPVTVPGKKGDGSPGTLTVSVSADTAGPGFNLEGAVKLTVPGFKGDPRFDKFYAKLATPISGGASGQERLMAEAGRSKIVTALKQELDQKLADKIRFQLPEGYLLYPEAITENYEESLKPAASGKTDESELVITAKPEAMIFNEASLTKAILAGRLAENLGEGVITESAIKIKNLAALIVAPDRSSVNPPKKQVEAAVDGTAQVVLTVDTDRLKTELSGSKKQLAQVIFAEYPGIARAQVKFNPPWVQRFPAEPSKIEIAIDESK